MSSNRGKYNLKLFWKKFVKTNEIIFLLTIIIGNQKLKGVRHGKF